MERKPTEKREVDKKKMKVMRIINNCLLVFIVLVMLMWNTGHVHAQREGPDLQTFLKKNIGFSKGELMALADVPAAGVKKPGFYLVYLDRLLFDEDLNWASRKLILKGVKSNVKSWLNALQKRLQDSYKNAKDKADHSN